MLTPQVVEFGGRITRPAYIVGQSVWNGLADEATLLWAYRRAQQTAFCCTPFRHIDGSPVIMAHVRQLDPRWAGLQRMQAMVHRALGELHPLLQAARGRRIGVALALPEDMGPNPVRVRRGGAAALEQLAQKHVAEHGGLPGCAVHTETRGHAGGAMP